MKISALVESREYLLERHLIKSKNILNESLLGLKPDQQFVVENIYNSFLPLIEASLTADQVRQLFGQIEQGATAAGGNRTLLGKGVDTAKQVDATINKIGKWLQDTTPVKNFDQKFEDLKGKISEKFPELSSKFSQMGQWAKDNPGKTAAIIGVMTTVAALAAGPVGGAIAGQILRGSAELLKGEKLSTAIGKGVKTAAYGFIAGKTFELIGDALSGGINTVKDTLVPGAVRGNFTRIFDEVGGPLGDRFASFEIKDLVGNPNDVNPIMALANDAANAWKQGDYEVAKTLWGQVQDGIEAMYTPEYLAQLASDQSTRELIGQGAKAVAGLADFMGAAAQGAIAGGIDNKDKEGESKPAAKESLYLQTRSLSEGQVYLLIKKIVDNNDRGLVEGRLTTDKFIAEGPGDFLKNLGKGAMGFVKGAAGAAREKLAKVGKNLTTKVTADKLEKAWVKAGSPSDSDEIYALIKQQGVAPEVIDTSFQAMKIKPPAGAGSTKPAEKPAAGAEKPAAADDQGTDSDQTATDADQPETPAAQSTGSSGGSGGKSRPAGQTLGLKGEPVDQDTDTATAEKPTATKPQAKPAAGSAAPQKVDVFALAKEIKSQKPAVVEAIKKLLSSKQSQRAA